MNKEDKMIEKKRLLVAERILAVKSACEKLIVSNIPITYSNIELQAAIPRKTLEREPYKGYIAEYKTQINTFKPNDYEIDHLKSEIKYLNLIIIQLRKENNNLKTLLLDSKL